VSRDKLILRADGGTVGLRGSVDQALLRGGFAPAADHGAFSVSLLNVVHWRVSLNIRNTQHMNFLSQPLTPQPVIEAFKKDIDRTLIRENLKLFHEERLLKLMQLQRFAHELRHAGRRARRESV
jgi:hypothetical protein